MAEKIVKANGIDICTEVFGDPNDLPILLVMGAAGSMLHWEVGFIEKLVAGARFVIRYDHRDTGKSTGIDFDKQPYTFGDMAGDAVGVLDALGIESAHAVGTSMGGMIVQLLALDHASRVRTITALMTTPDPEALLAGIRGESAPGALPGPKQELLDAIATAEEFDQHNVQAMVDSHLRQLRVGYDSAHRVPEAKMRAIFEANVARADDFSKLNNHGLAGAVTPAWKDRLGEVDVPTLVFHGDDDPLVQLPHGRALVDAIPGAQLVIQEGVGHAIPEEEWDGLATAILKHTAA